MPSTSELLNPDLYLRLCELFGKGNVNVNYAGEPGQFGKASFQSANGQEFHLAKVGDYAGEEYLIDCPFCNDTRKRMQVNYRFGTADPYTGKPINWLINCFNEGCQEDWQNRLEMLRSVTDGYDGLLHLNKKVAAKPERTKELALPSGRQNIHVLAQQEPNHPASVWCMSRYLDTQVLAERYGVCYCPPFSHSSVADRIVAPFYVRNGDKVSLAGWTARAVSDDFEGPKWRHSKSAVGSIVYGLGEASKCKVLVVTEGPGDKWAVGQPGVAVFGKKLTNRKADQIADVLSKKKIPCIVLLDPEMDSEQKARGKEHHNVVATRMLRQRVSDVPVLDVRLPIGTDPGSLDRVYLWEYIKREAKSSKIDIDLEEVLQFQN